MKIVFLDITGVLISDNYNNLQNNTLNDLNDSYQVDPICALHLRNIVKEKDTFIVITEDKYKDMDSIVLLKEKLNEYDIDSKISGVTPTISDECKSDEIMLYLSLMEYIESYAIISANNLSTKVCNEHRLSICDKSTGLKLSNVRKVEEILSK